LVNWLPGEEGGPATADVLFGDYNPGGRLPMTFPRSAAQLPLYYNFKPSGRGYNYVDMDFTPLYRFGFGLSYTSFEYSDLTTEIRPDGNIDLQVSVKNTGGLQGDEVVQLYLTDMYSSVDTRVMELKDFNRISLKPNESKRVSFTLTPYQLSFLNDKMDRVVEAGSFKIMVGGMSPSFVAADEIKNSVGFRSPAKGLNTTIDYKKSFAADFELKPVGWMNDSVTGKQKYAVRVENKGNITDAGKLRMFLNGKLWGEHHFEITPGGNKEVQFDLSTSDLPPNGITGAESDRTVFFATKYKSISIKL
jgi:beta-glucosidase